jgi:hypothetical protein
MILYIIIATLFGPFVIGLILTLTDKHYETIMDCLDEFDFNKSSHGHGAFELDFTQITKMFLLWNTCVSRQEDI